MSKFDLKGARDAGYSDTEILEGLAKHQPKFDLKGAREAGYDDTVILEGLAGHDFRVTTTEKVKGAISDVFSSDTPKPEVGQPAQPAARPQPAAAEGLTAFRGAGATGSWDQAPAAEDPQAGIPPIRDPLGNPAQTAEDAIIERARGRVPVTVRPGEEIAWLQANDPEALAKLRESGAQAANADIAAGAKSFNEKLDKQNAENVAAAEEVKAGGWKANLKSGLYSATGGLYGALAATAENLSMYDKSPVAEKLLELSNKQKDWGQAIQTEASKQNFRDADSRVQWMADQFLLNAPSTAVTLASIFSPASAPYALGTMAAYSGGGHYTDLRNAGVDNRTATLASVAYGGLEAAIERAIPVELGQEVLKRFRALAPLKQAQLGQRIVRGIAAAGATGATMLGSEGAEEWVTGIVQRSIDKAVKSKMLAEGNTEAAAKVGTEDVYGVDEQINDFMGGVAGGAPVAGAVGGAGGYHASRGEREPEEEIGLELQRSVDQTSFAPLDGGPGAAGPGEAEARAAVESAFGKRRAPAFNPMLGGLSRAANIAIDNGLSQQVADQQAAIEAAELLDEEGGNADQGAKTELDQAGATAGAGDAVAGGGVELSGRGGEGLASGGDSGSPAAGNGLAGPAGSPLQSDAALTDDRVGAEETRTQAATAPATATATAPATATAGGPIARVGTTPKSTEDVTVRDGVVYMGDYPAQNFESGEDVRIDGEPTFEAVSRALKEAGALSSRQRIYATQATDNAQAAGVNPFKRAYETLVSGSLPQGVANPELAKAAFDAGKIKSPGDLRRFEEKGYPKSLLPKAPKQKKPEAPAATADEYAERARKRFIKTIKDIGGISSTEARDITGERNANKMAPGLFRREGNGMDLVARRLHEAGYLTDAEYEDVDGGVQAARDLVNQALGREPVLSAAEQERYNELLAQEQRLEEEMLASDEALAEMLADEVSETQLDAITDEDGDIDLPDFGAGETDTAASMRALGFTEKEIEDAINDEQAAKHHQAAGGAPAGAREEGAATGQGQTSEAGFALQGQTPAEVKAAEDAARTKADAKARADAAADAKKKADAERDSFSLTGSDRAADANPGQADIFAQPAQSATGPLRVTQDADAGHFSVRMAKDGSSMGTFQIVDGKVRNIKARAQWALDDVTAAANKYAADNKPGKLEAAASKIDDELNAALDELAAALKPKGQLNSGIDPAILALGVKVGSLYVAKGVVKFAQYSQAIIDALKSRGIDADQIKPYLKQFYAATKQAVDDATFDKMDDDRTVRGFDLEKMAAPRVERRTNLERRQRIDEMTLEEARLALRTDELTGIGNRRAWNEAEGSRAFIASIDADSLKWINDNMSPESGDAMLRAIGKTLADEMPAEDVFHISGDEFIAHSDDRAALDEAMARAQERLAAAIITIDKPDGSTIELEGVKFTYGIGGTKNDADHLLKREKLAKEQRGERASRGETPRGITVRSPVKPEPAGRQPDQGSDRPAEEVAPDAPIERIVGDKLETNLPEVEHVTTKGKTLKGVITKTLTLDQARAVDKFAWKKDGGVFVRMKHVVRPAAAAAPAGDNRAVQQRWDAAHARSYKLDDPAVTAAREAFENGDIEIEEYEAALDKAERAAAGAAPAESKKKRYTYAIKPLDGGFIIESDNGGGTVLSRKPRGPELLDPVPPRVFKSEADARAYMQEKGMEEATGNAHAAATAPEHVVGVDDRELGEIVDEFNAAQKRATSDPEAITHVFDEPAKGEIVRLGDKAKVYHKEHGWMTPAEARAKIAEWKEHAAKQGETHGTENSQRVVLSLFDLSGEWSKPWEEAGYQVYRFDIQADAEVGDVNNFSTEFFNDWFGSFDGMDIYAVLAACPCTDFAVSGARHFAAKDEDGRTVASVKLVHQTLNAIEYFKPAVWAIENPVGRIEKLGGLPPWRLSFDPNHLGDPYTKKTLLWGRFNGDLPVAPVEPTEGSKMHRLYGGKSQATKNARSVTPEGFAYSFFMANNAVDHPAMAIANKYDRLDRDVIERAVKAGVTEAQIDEAVEDFYYMDLDDAAANDAIRALIPGKPDGGNGQTGYEPSAEARDRRAAYEKMAAERGEAYASGYKSQKTGFSMHPPSVYRKQSERNQWEQGWIDAKRENDGSRVTPQLMTTAQFNGFVKIAADSVEKLRRQDVERVLDETPAHFKTDMAMRLKDARPDLVDEINDLMADDKPAAQETREPKTLDEFIGAVDAGYKAHYDYAGTDGVTVWIEKTDKGWVVKSQEDGSNVTATHGGVSPVGGWDKLDALKRVERDAKHRFTEWKPLADQAPSRVEPGELVQAMNDLAEVRQRIEDQGRVVDDRLLERERQLRKLINELSEPDQLAPGTRINGDVERAAADRLELLAEKMAETRFPMNSPEWAAMRSLKSVAEELRKPRTVVSVNEILQAAWEKMGKYGAYADVIEEVMDSLDKTEAAAKTKQEGQKDAGNLQEAGVPAGRAGGDQAQRQPGDRVGESLDAGVAGTSGQPAGDRGVSGGVQAGARAGAGRAGSGNGQRAPRADGDRGNGGARNGAADGQLDHVITDEDGIGEGGLAAKYRDNVAAIKIIKATEAEGRVATAEERRALARYVGWGALKGVFDPNNKTWAKQHKELRDLLTDEEWDSARASILNAHYTSPTVIKAMYEAVDQLGFKGGRILEPSMGSGNFFGMMPAAMRSQSKLHGVELDSLTSRLARALYPNAVIATSTGFQAYEVPSGYFDMAIGNPPFGSEPIVDRERNEYSGFSIHNYFIARMIDKTRDGGIVPVIVSHSFMDAINPKAREWVAKRANLLGAVRLPETAFKNNAGTEVVTDILFFQKTATPEKSPAWVNSTDVTLQNPKSGDTKAVSVNDYFTANPRNVLGRQSLGGSMYAPNTYTVEQTGNLDDQLIGFINDLPANVYQPIERAAEEVATADNTVPDGVKPGSYYIDDKGAVRQRGNDVAGMKVSRPWEAPNAGADSRMRGMIRLREMLRNQMRMELGEVSTKELDAGRAELNKAYDAFVKAHGYINSQTNRRIFLDDTESALLQALEFDYDPGVSKAKAASSGLEEKKPSATKADILKRRVLFPPSTEINVGNAKDALLSSLNEKGRVDMSYMAAAYGKTEDEIVDELGDVLFNDPQAGYATADEYLSGDVKTKLDEARAAAKGDPRFERNVKALEKVIPADKMPSEIFASIGANWIPVDVYQQFAEEITGSKEVTASYLAATAQWFASMERGGDLNKLEGEYGTGSLNSFELFKLMLNGRAAEVRKKVTIDGKERYVVDEDRTEAARQKMDKIKQRWESWVWSDPERSERLAGIFNEKHNRTVSRGYDGSHMTLPGTNPAITLRPHQKNVIWRGIQERNVLLDHVVGAGKTYAMTGTIMEMKRLGIARKPLFAVPNHLTLQWRSDFSRLYPAANVLAATPEDFSKDNRERLFAKIATGEYDAVVVGHSSLKKIALNPEIEQRMYKEQLDEISASIEELKRERGDKNIIRDMEKIKANLEAKIEKLVQLAGKRDKVVTFDELGIDALFVDEMHEFKNLFFYTQKQRVSGLGNPAGSGKAFDLFMKVRWMQQAFGERTPFVTATGTPVSNSLAEMFTMQRYMRFDELKRNGLHLFDSWSRMYGEDEYVYEVAPSGVGYRISQRFSKFKNLPSLMGHYKSFADVVTLQDLKDHAKAAGKRFPVPKIEGGRQKNIVAKRSPLQRDFFGVPVVRRDEDGRIVFEIANPAAMRIEENPDSKDEKTAFKLHGNNSVSYHPTREDAELALVERSLTPVLDLDPKSLVGQFNNLRQLTRDTKGKINALSLTGLANKAGLDYRLIDPHAPDFPGSKINMAVDNIAEIHKKWAKDRGTQLVFCDLSVPLSAKAAAASNEKRLYVLDDKGELTHKKGTLNTIEGYEGFPFYLVRTGKGAQATVQAYEPVTGILLKGGFADRTEAKAWAGDMLSTEAGRDKWFEARESREPITAERIGEYRDDAGLEVDEDGSNEFSPDDLEAMSSAGGFSVYDDIKAKLVERGIKENEIAFIHDYNTPKQKSELFKRVKAGEVRILMGSTPKLGAGTNVQDRLVALHHVDAPWRPSDLEQREGRIIRQGNMLYDRDPDGFEVFIGRYATEQTYDTRRWQLLEHKASGIEQLRKYSGEAEIDDVAGEAANAADMKAAASGNPLILEETKLRTEVKRLTALRRAHEDSKFAMGSRLKHLRNSVNTFIPSHLAQIEDALAKSAKHPEPEEKGAIADITIDGKKAKDRETAEKLIGELFTRARAGGMFGSGGKIVYRGVTFEVEDEGRSVVSLSSPIGMIGTWTPESAVSSSGVITRMDNSLDRLPGLKERVQAQLEEDKAEIQSIESRINGEFEQDGELAAATERHAIVQRKLMKSTQMDAVPKEARAEFLQDLDARKRMLADLGYSKAVKESSRDDDAAFSRSGVPGRAESVQKIVDRVVAGWANAPEVIVAQSMQDESVPAAVRNEDAAMRDQGAEGEPNGFFYRGRVYLIANQTGSRDAVISTLMHEALGHAGLRGTFGNELAPILRQIVAARRADVAAKAAEYGLDMDSEKGRLIAAEEVLAEMAQTRPEIGFVKRAIAAIRNWLRAHGMDLEMTDTDMVQAFILPARRFIERGGKPASKRGGVRFVRIGDTFAGYDTREEYEARLEADRKSNERLAELYRAELERNPLKAPGRLEAAPRRRAGNGDTWAGYATREEYERAAGDTAFSRDGLQSRQEEENGQVQTAGSGVPAGKNARRTVGGAPRAGWAGATRIRRNDGKPAAAARGAGVALAPEHFAQASLGKNTGNPSSGLGVWFALTGQDEVGRYGPVIEKFHLDIRRPKVYTSDTFPAFDSADAAHRHREALRAQGYDGIVVDHREVGGPVHAVAFDADQVIYPDDGDGPRFSRQGALQGVTAPQAPQLTRQPPLGVTGGFAGSQATWAAPIDSAFDDFVRKYQNKHVDMKRVVQAVTDATGQLADRWNPYLQEELFHGRTAKRVLDFVERELNPIMREAAKLGLTLDEIDHHLWARHAEEANILIAQRDPNMADAGSGMKTADARAYFAGLPPKKLADLTGIANRIDAIIADTRQLYVDYGLIDRGTATAWAGMFKHYVPLMREDKDGAMGMGQGYSVRGKEVKHRTGSTRAVVDVLANIAMQREKAIVRGEKNRVAVALAGLAKLNPNQDFWTFDKVPTERVLNETTGLVESRPDPRYKDRDNVIVAKIRGRGGNIEERAIVFREDNERAMKMAEALKNIDVTPLEGVVMPTFAAITRYMASINTQYNPIFGVVNLTRDVQGAVLNLTSTPIKGKQAKVFRDAFSALSGIYRDTRAERRGGIARSPWAAEWEEFTKNGGQTGYRDMFANSEDRSKALRRALDPTAWMESKLGRVFTAGGALRVPLSVAQKQAGWLFDWLSDFNTTMENAVRLAAYKAAKDAGMTPQQAASLAKNLTTNFNRRGQVGQQAGALYAFFNAAVQGTARIGDTLTTMEPGKPRSIRLSRAGGRIIAGGVLLGVIQAVMLALAGFDEDEPPEFVRERNIIIPLGPLSGKKNYITIPMPLGFHVLPNIGRHAAEAARDGKPGKHAAEMLAIMAEAFNPFGSAGMSLQTVMPTAFDPLVALAENRDWTGRPIYRETFGDELEPGFERAKSTASAFSKALSEWVHYATGGTEYVAGALSPSPDQIDYLLGQFTGGVGRELSKVEQSATALWTGEDLPAHKIPLFGRFYGSAEGKSGEASRYYSNLDRAKRHEREVMGRLREGKPADDYYEENPDADLFAEAKGYDRLVKSLRKEKLELIRQKASREEVRAIEDQITEAMREMNELAKELREQ